MRGLLYIAILLIITSCTFSGSQTKVLDEAQLLMQQNPEEALTKLNTIDISKFDDSSTMARWALLYSEALAVNNLSAPTDTIINIAVEYYGSHHQTEEFEKANRLKTQIKAATNNSDIATAHYLRKEKEFYLYKEKARREKIMLIGSIVLLLAAGIIIWMHQRLKFQSLRNDSLMAEATTLRNALNADHHKVKCLEGKIHGLLDNRFALVDSLCQTYYETQGTKAERKAIIEKVKSEIEALRSDSFAEMESAVNDCRDNLLLKVKKLYPGIKSEEYQLLVYLAGGLSIRTISLLLGETVEVIYKRKSRLKSRMKKIVEPTCCEIMEIF